MRRCPPGALREGKQSQRRRRHGRHRECPLEVERQGAHVLPHGRTCLRDDHAMRAVGASIEIDADIETVWSVLVEVDHYPEWNPFTVSVATTFELGSPVEMQVALRGRRNKRGEPRTMHQVEYVTSFDAERRRLSWGVNVGPAWFILADRWQQLTDLGDGRTRYETSDEFTGVGVTFMLLLMRKHVERGFGDVARGLKAHCES